MVETIIKEGGLCFMLDGEHKGRVGVCVGIYLERNMIKLDFVFADGSMSIIYDFEKKPDVVRYNEFCNN